jgi:hypothetical protein
MDNRSGRQPEFFFDIQSGELLIGQLAVEVAIEAGSNPMDIQSFPELLTQKERVIGPKHFSPMPYENWDSSDDVVVAEWLHNVVSQDDLGKTLSEEVITRAGYLSLVPRLNYFKSRDGGLVGIYKKAGLEGVRTRSLCDSWTTSNFVVYVNDLAKTLGRKPAYNDLLQAGRMAGNPSPQQINRHFKEGGLAKLFELAGYPNIKAWTESDYIAWGVKFMFANDGKVPTSRAMATLSATHRGPHYSSIYDNVGSMIEYQERVQEEYEIELKYGLFEKEEKLRLIEKETEDGSYPDSLAQKYQTEDEIIATHARYRLLKYLVPALEEKYLRQNAIIQRPNLFVLAIQRANTALTAGQIETSASILGIFDDIWPMNEHLRYLRVS